MVKLFVENSMRYPCQTRDSRSIQKSPGSRHARLENQILQKTCQAGKPNPGNKHVRVGKPDAPFSAIPLFKVLFYSLLMFKNYIGQVIIIYLLFRPFSNPKLKPLIKSGDPD